MSPANPTIPHRDPDTGQFLSGDHAGAWADADDVLRIETFVDVGDDTVTGVDYAPNAQVDNHLALEMQKDYRLLGLEAFLDTEPYNTEVTQNSPQANNPTQQVTWQLGTTGTFSPTADPANGGAMPPGVVYQHHTKAASPVVWDDDTNQNAGSWGGFDTKYAEAVPAEKIINADVSPDAGTSYNLHLDIRGDFNNAEATRHRFEGRLYMAERQG